VIYVATVLAAGTPTPDPTEDLSMRWVSLADALHMIDRGEIHDGMTQIGLLALDRERAARRSP
jgi:hypothetical protein